jgi:hypothetical protein
MNDQSLTENSVWEKKFSIVLMLKGILLNMKHLLSWLQTIVINAWPYIYYVQTSIENVVREGIQCIYIYSFCVIKLRILK